MHNNDELQKLEQELTAKNSFQISLTLNLKRMQTPQTARRNTLERFVIRNDSQNCQ